MRAMRSHLLLILVPLALTACSKKDGDGTTPAASSSAPTTAASAVDPTPAASATAETPKPAATNLPLIGEDAPEFKLVEKPTAADVTSGPLMGSANGHKFEPKAIYFEPEKKGWKLSIGDKPLEKPTAFSPSGSQTIYISLNTPKLAAGKKLTKAMKYGDGFFQIVQPENQEKTTSWNTDNAYYLEITKWDVKPYDAKAGMFQQAGTASGKLYVVHKASESLAKKGFKTSGVAGTFTDAVVRYRGEPKFE